MAEVREVEARRGAARRARARISRAADLLLVIAALPCVPAALAAGLVELALGTDTDFTRLVVRPFTWAVERRARRRGVR